MPPRVAHCVAGLIRSLPHPLVYRSLRRNLVEPFGGTPFLFLLLKPWDVTPKRAGHFPSSAVEDLAQGVHWSDAQVRMLLRPVLAELHPLVVSVRLLNVSEDDPDRLFNPHCPIRGRHYGLSSGVYTTKAGLVRLLGQAAASDACLRMIEASERANGTRFDLVTRLRPDVAYLAPVRAWSAFPDPRVAYIHDRDWFIVVHRVLADAALGSFALYKNCTTVKTEETPEEWLRLAIREGGGRARIADFPVGLVGTQSCSDTCTLHRSVMTNAASAPFASYFHNECKYISQFVGCFGDTPVHCRSRPCMHALASAQQRATLFASLQLSNVSHATPTSVHESPTLSTV